MKTIHLARGLTLPAAELATEVVASLGQRGSGKSNGAGVIAEGLLAAGVQVIVLDHVGIWWALRMDETGKHPSPYEIPVLGGQHGDLVLVPTTGAVVAEALARSGSSAVLDVSAFSKGDRCRFAADFAEAFFRTKKLHPGAVQILLEEAQRYCLTQDTEILTQTGWKHKDQVTVGDQAMAFDLETDACRLEPIQEVIEQDFDGELVRYKTTSIDSMVTPDHRVVLRRCQRGKGRYKLYPWTFCQAGGAPSQFIVPSARICDSSGLDISDDMLRLIGWIATDGYFNDRTKGYLGLQQTHTTMKLGVSVAATMCEVLGRMGVKGVYQRPGRITKSMTRVLPGNPSVQFYLGTMLSQMVRRWIGDEIHRIPREVMEKASPAQLAVLYTGLLEGDGTSQNGIWTKFYPGHNEGLADDFQEVATRLGIRTSKVKVPQNGQWTVRISHTKDHWIRPTNISRVPYTGKVWCVRISSGAFVARRNGMVFVTGNCPQKLFAGQGLERMLGAFEEIAEVGRNFGVGLHLISQRPQKINKDVLNLADTVLAYRANGVLERKAISEWVQEKGAEGRKEMHDELPGLARGTAIVWSPSRAIYGRYAIEKKTTYDAGATPIQARAAVKTKRLDLDKLEEVMGAAVEEAKTNDPRMLRARIAELEREMVKKPTTPTAVERTKIKTVEVPMLGKRDLHRIEQLTKCIRDFNEQLDRNQRVEAGVRAEINMLNRALQALVHESKLSPESWRQLREGIADARAGRTQPVPLAVIERPRHVRAVDRGSNGVPAPAGDPGDLPSYALDLLNVVAQRGVASDAQISALSGYRRTSSAFPKMLAKLTNAGLIEGDSRERTITDAGRARAGATEPLPTGRALLDHWLSKLTGYERLFLQTIHDARTISREELAARTERSMGSSAFPKTIAALARLALIDAPRGGDLTIAESFR